MIRTQYIWGRSKVRYGSIGDYVSQKKTGINMRIVVQLISYKRYVSFNGDNQSIPSAHG